MPALFLFLFKVNIALVLFCLGYYLVLRHLTFYTLNRIYLVTAIVFSSLYPGINLTDFAQRHQQLTQPVQTVISSWKAPAVRLVEPLYRPNYWQWAEVIFWAGVILFAVRLSMQLFSLYKLYRQSKPGHMHDQHVRLISDDISPFSFWRSIYINPSRLSPSELKNVLEHEQVHVSQWHTLDILLAELSTIFYWFNPGVWLMKKAVRENIEFITDRKILQKGMDRKEYQYSLLSVGLAAQSNTLVNHFNMSTIKKRIIMINTTRSSGYKLTRYVFLVPAVIALLLVISLSKAEISKKGMHTLAAVISRVTNANISRPPLAVTAAISSSKKAAATHADTIYSGKSKDGKKSIMMTSDKSSDSLTYVINGVRGTKQQLDALDPGKVMSLEMLPADKAKKFFPEADSKRYVLFVTTDDSEAGKKLKEQMDKSMGTGELTTTVKNISVIGLPPPPRIVEDSRVSVSSNKSQDVAPMVVSDTNVSTNVTVTAAPKVATKIQTKRVYVTGTPKTIVTVNRIDADSVMVVDKWDEAKITADKNVKKFHVTNEEVTLDNLGKTLFIIDGKEAKSLKDLSPADINTISVLKGAAAEKQYGEKGKNGVVVITTKKAK
jgi:bla regulator protein blaR1